MRNIATPVVVLKLPRTPKGVLYFARAVHAAMSDNPYFPVPRPLLPVFGAHIDALFVAETAVLTGGRGAKAERDARLAVVRSDLESLRVYVSQVAAQSVVEGLAIVESAGMSAKRVGGSYKGELTIKDGLRSGEVEIVARAVAKQASYEWQYSQDGSVWIDLEPTLQASTTLSGLTRCVRYAFRFRALYRGGRGDFGQVVWHLVV
jgi:hypothetical protein